MEMLAMGIVTRCAVLTLFVSAAAFSLRAQDKSCTAIVILASASDEQGMPAGGLTAGSFSVKVGGKVAKVLSAAEQASRRKVAILLDASPSMRDDSNGKWSLAREIAAHIVENGPASETPPFAVFGETARPADRTSSLELMTSAQAFQQLAVTGLALAQPYTKPPRLFDSLYEGLALLGETRRGDVLFVVTDGGEQGSKTKPSALLNVLVRRGIRLFAVTLPTKYDAEVVVIRGASDAEALRQKENTDFLNLVDFSGGGLLRIHPNRRTNEWGFKFTDEERVRMATSLQLLYLRAARFYQLEVEVPKDVATALEQRLEISVNPPARRGTIRVDHVRKLIPCPLS
jgi:hypothetical protein